MSWGEPAQNILVIGATGVVGTYITRAIVDAQHLFNRICVLTSEKTVVEKVQDICALESWGVEVFVGRLEDERKVKEAYKGKCAPSGEARATMLMRQRQASTPSYHASAEDASTSRSL